MYLILAYKLYILPILNYVSPVWSPSSLCYILKIESIQRTFTKKLQGFDDLSYKERLQKSGLESLELMRLRADLILCYKILHGLIQIDSSQMFDYDSYYGPRSHGLILRAPKVRTDYILLVIVPVIHGIDYLQIQFGLRRSNSLKLIYTLKICHIHSCWSSTHFNLIIIN